MPLKEMHVEGIDALIEVNVSGPTWRDLSYNFANASAANLF